MAVQTYYIRNSVDGKYDVFHWDPTTSEATVDPTSHLKTADKSFTAVEGNQGTGNGKKDSHRDTDENTAKNR